MPYGKYKTDYGGTVDFARLTRERRAKAATWLEKYKLDGLLTFDGANARYLTVGRSGATGYSGYKYVLFPTGGNPIHHDAGMNAKALQYAVDDLDTRPSIAMPPEMVFTNLPAYKFQLSKFVNQIKQELKETGITDGVIGVDGAGPFVVEALKEAGVRVSPEGAAAMAMARLTKTRDEIELLRCACAICEAGFQAAKEMIRPGVSEREVWAEISRRSFQCGAEAVEGGHVCSGPHSYPIANTISDRLIRPGDIILIDIYNISYHGYRTCYYASFSCGEPTKRQKECWDKARDLTDQTISRMKPGYSTRDMVAGWPKAEEYGYKDEDDATMAQWAHGIGLAQYETPAIGRSWSIDYPQELLEGMTLAVETQWPTGEITTQYPHGQCLRIEDEVVITKNGCEKLSQWPRDQITVCW
jgi:Xaa-Pro aminopeptidase